ncbi:MAG: hypothetical protein RL095_3128 [Verrucomicrobiota bacterium]|jgi:hemoglobin/transferrin/lactoferrin receptor protein
MKTAHLFLTSLLLPCLLQAQEKAPAPETPATKNVEDKFQIIGTPYEGQKATEVPATVHRLSEEDVRLRLGTANFADTLSRTPGVTVQKTGPGRGNPIIRGFSGSRNMVLADGVRLNNPILREGPNEYWNTLDPWAYTNTEVILGPGSLRYGSDAIGGVVVTGTEALPVGEANAGWQNLDNDLWTRFSTKDMGFQEAFRSRGAYNDTDSYAVGLSRGDHNDQVMSGGETLDNSAYTEMGGYLRWNHAFDLNNKLILGYDRYQVDDLNRIHTTLDGRYWHGTSVGGTFTDSLANLRARDKYRLTDLDRHSAFVREEFRGGEGFISDADYQLSFQRIEEDSNRYRNYLNPAASSRRHEYRWYGDNTYAANLRLQTDTEAVKFQYGVDASHDSVQSSGRNVTDAGVTTKRIQGDVADEARYEKLGGWIQGDIHLNDRLDLVLGSRYDVNQMDAEHVNLNNVDSSLEHTWYSWTNSAHLVLKLDDQGDSSIFAGVRQGYRAPNLSDTTRDGEFGTNQVALPNTNFDPEHYTTWELGVKAQDAEGQWHGFASVFYTRIEDQITRVTTAGQSHKAGADGYMYGWELGGDYYLTEQVGVFGSLAMVDGVCRNHYQQNDTNPLIDDQYSKVPPLNGEFGLRFRDGKEETFFLDTYCEWSDGQDDLSQADRTDTDRIPPNGTPGWYTVNARAGWKFAKNQDVTLGLENLLDKDYRIHGSGQNEPGRSLTLQYHLKF